MFKFRTEITTLLILCCVSFIWSALPQAHAQLPQDPNDLEQLIVYELNRARNKPARFGRENAIPVDLTDAAPSSPLAVNNSLVGSASFHAEEMATFNYFAHQSAVTGDWPNKMARDHGYPLPGFYPDSSNNIESLAAGTFIDTASEALALLIEDAGVVPPGHRNQLLALVSFFQTHREIGTGHAFNNSATYKNYFAIHTAVRDSGGDQFLTGVVYEDTNGNNRYDLGEGLGGVSVGNGLTMVSSNPAGGWSISVAPGTYTVEASGGSFAGTASAVAVVTDNNVEVDFVSGNPLGEINFHRQDNGSPVDLDGDKESDVTVYGTGTGHWFYLGSTAGFDSQLGFGGANYVPVPGDYDGDGQTDTAVYDTATGNWFIDQSTAGFAITPAFGGAGYVPISGDYDGDGQADIGVYDPSTGNWFWLGSTSGFDSQLGFGGANYVPVPGDYDGDGQTDTAVYDTATGDWFIDQSTAGFTIVPAFGGSGYVPVLPQVTILRSMGLL